MTLHPLHLQATFHRHRHRLLYLRPHHRRPHLQALRKAFLLLLPSHLLLQ